ncbi:MAG TPA: hypothetical protein PLQ35_08825 [bacterium]|nr:hypothetical protein [bacterium]HQL62385.1 hypothetical protein [bacterium]
MGKGEETRWWRAIKVTTYEGVMEKGQIRFPANVRIAGPAGIALDGTVAAEEYFIGGQLDPNGGVTYNGQSISG